MKTVVKPNNVDTPKKLKSRVKKKKGFDIEIAILHLFYSYVHFPV